MTFFKPLDPDPDPKDPLNPDPVPDPKHWVLRCKFFSTILGLGRLERLEAGDPRAASSSSPAAAAGVHLRVDAGVQADRVAGHRSHTPQPRVYSIRERRSKCTSIT